MYRECPIVYTTSRFSTPHRIPLTIFERLKEGTRQLHLNAEQRMGLNVPMTLGRYRRLIAALYGFYAPLEQRLFAAEGLMQVVPDIESRRKTPWLITDLTVLGHDAADLGGFPSCNLIPATRDISRILGTLYVVEGATLGGGLIGPLINRQLHITPSTGGRFFLNYGEKRVSMWQLFKNNVSDDLERPGSQETLLTAACDTFAAFDTWLSQHYE
jgi:heme oxygenase